MMKLIRIEKEEESKMNEISAMKNPIAFSCYKNSQSNFQKQFILSPPPFTQNNMFSQVRNFSSSFKTSIIKIEMEVIMTCQSRKFYVLKLIRNKKIVC